MNMSDGGSAHLTYRDEIYKVSKGVGGFWCHVKCDVKCYTEGNVGKLKDIAMETILSATQGKENE